MRKLILYFLLISYFSACNQMDKEAKTKKPDKSGLDLRSEVYGMIGTDTVHQYTITNAKGMVIKFLDYGLTVTNLLVPGKDGAPGDVVLGFDSLGGYLQPGNPYFGCVVGRYANRIANAKFVLDGKTYQLAANNNGNSLHGGLKGFDKVLWTKAGSSIDSNSVSVEMKYNSHDGEEGYPGNLAVTVTYSLTNDNEFRIHYLAETDKPTPVNLTNHCYFNLSAGRDSTIENHVLMINANKYTEVNDKLIPTGALPDVKGGPMDFTSPKRIGNDLGRVNGGYDHNWVLVRSGSGLEKVASLSDPGSGRYMEVYTTQPGLQFYSGNFLDGSLVGKNGKKYVQHGGLCLETQHFPDSPNQPSFPNTVLKPGEKYDQSTVYKFSVKP